MFGYRVGFECVILRYAIGSWQGKGCVGLDCVISNRRRREITGEPGVKQAPLWLGGPSAERQQNTRKM